MRVGFEGTHAAPCGGRESALEGGLDGRRAFCRNGGPKRKKKRVRVGETSGSG